MGRIATTDFPGAPPLPALADNNHRPALARWFWQRHCAIRCEASG
jgi:hypothetical protein